MIHTVVFDFGNVVSFFDHSLAASRLARYSDLPAPMIHRYLFGGDLEDAYESGRLSSAEFVQRVRKDCRLTCSDDVLIAGYVDLFWRNEAVCRLLPRLRARYRLLLGSNTTELHSSHFRRLFADTFAHFDALVLSHEIGVRKPRAAFFEHCQRTAGSAPDECLFIDDLPANVDGARACGWHGLVYRGGAEDELRQDLAAVGVQAG